MWQDAALSRKTSRSVRPGPLSIMLSSQVVCFSLLAFLWSPCAYGQQILTAGLIVRSANQISNTLSTLGTASLANGQAITGQQQLLLGSIINVTAGRIASAYSSSLDRSVTSLEAAQHNSLQNFTNLLNTLNGIGQSTGAQYSELVTDAVGVAHKVLDTIPSADKPPVIYGVALAGVISSLDDPTELKILGYHLMETQANARPPDVLISGWPSSNLKVVSADFESIVAKVPTNLISKIGHRDTACNPIEPFTLSVHVYFASGILNGFLRLSSEVILLAPVRTAPPRYEIIAEFTAIPIVAKPDVFPFSVTSSYVDVGCDQTAPMNLVWRIPGGAKVLASQAQWVDTSNVVRETKEVSSTDDVVTAFGSITGLNRQCAIFGICNCPGGGHGRLTLSGTYSVANKEPHSVVIQSVIQRDSIVHIPFDKEWALTDLKIGIKRNGCDQVFDRVSISVGHASERELAATSLEGYFAVRVDSDSVSVHMTNTGPE